jgi:hypothetical protein
MNSAEHYEIARNLLAPRRVSAGPWPDCWKDQPPTPADVATTTALLVVP